MALDDWEKSRPHVNEPFPVDFISWWPVLAHAVSQVTPNSSWATALQVMRPRRHGSSDPHGDRRLALGWWECVWPSGQYGSPWIIFKLRLASVNTCLKSSGLESRHRLNFLSHLRRGSHWSSDLRSIVLPSPCICFDHGHLLSLTECETLVARSFRFDCHGHAVGLSNFLPTPGLRPSWNRWDEGSNVRLTLETIQI